MPDTPLGERLKTRIRSEGPLSVAEYMTLCLLDPSDGFYPTRDPLGSDGDFITAPEISQMFGEVLGLWCLQAWKDLGAPETLHLVELGPGRGTMMSDILRATRLDPGFSRVVRIHLIEASAALQAVQGRTLGHATCPVFWHDRIADVPAGPTLVLGNEYLDCLPIRQFVQRDPFAGRAGWHERVVGVVDDRLTFALSDAPIASVDQATLPDVETEARLDALIETCPAISQLVDDLAARFATHPGRALFIDYGPAESELGDTLQAIARHERLDPLATPGEADLTARVDFQSLIQSAKAAGLAAYGSVTQAGLLSRLGIELRAVALTRAEPDTKPVIARQLHRLMDADQMGTLFKAVCLSSRGLPTPLGFTA